MDKKTKFIEKASYNWSDDSIRLFNTPSQVARSIYFYVQETGYFKTTYPYFTERANLSSFLILYTISGKGHLHYQKSTYTLTEGTLFFISCMEPHRYETPFNSAWEFLWLHFNGSNALGYYEEFSRNGSTVLQVQDNFLIESTLRRIVAINQKRNPTTEIATSNLIINILSELLIQNCTPNGDIIMMPGYIKAVMRYIDTNFRERILLDNLAEKFSVNKYHLLHEFKKYSGITVNEYLILQRMSYAKELLKYSDLPVSEITFCCGMNHVSHFINLFKNREHTTPYLYRKEWQNNNPSESF